jgi:hypothetical protein
MDREIRFHDRRVGPYAIHERILAQQLAMMFDQNDENLEGSAPDPDRFAPFQQKPLKRKQAKGTKQDRGRGSAIWFGRQRMTGLCIRYVAHHFETWAGMRLLWSKRPSWRRELVNL